jgi:transposase
VWTTPARQVCPDLSSVVSVVLDLAKYVFQVRGVDVLGRVMVAKAIRRKKLLQFLHSATSCVVGLKACRSAHHWARADYLGRDAVMMPPPGYVKPHFCRQKNDATDAAAICEAGEAPFDAVCKLLRTQPR